MRITRESAQKQAKRLMACPALAPQSDEGKREVVDCLMRHCQSPEHAAEVMTAFLDTAIDPRNITAELASIARQSRLDDALPTGCPACTLEPDEATGAPRYASHVTGERNGYDIAARCKCPRGISLKERDRKRDADEAAERSRRFAGANA